MFCFTRYQLFLQLKKDLVTGKLECPFELAVELSAYSLQCKSTLQAWYVDPMRI